MRNDVGVRSSVGRLIGFNCCLRSFLISRGHVSPAEGPQFCFSISGRSCEIIVRGVAAEEFGALSKYAREWTSRLLNYDGSSVNGGSIL